jgi:hypothetical protein
VKAQHGAKGDKKSMKLEYVRNGKQQILGTKTTDGNGITTARDRRGKILGNSNSKMNLTRDSRGRLVRSNEADTDCLFK